MWQDPGAPVMLNVPDHALGFLAQFGGVPLQPTVQFVEFVFNLLYVGEEQRGVARLSNGMEICHPQILAVDQFVETDFQVAGDNGDFA